MDFSKFVQPIADYFNFLINFWIYGQMPDPQFQALGEISADALTLFLMAIFFNYLVVQFRPFDFDEEGKATTHSIGKVEAHAVFGTIPLIFFSAILFEVVLWMFGVRAKPANEAMGNFADTINGHLLMLAATSALVSVIQIFADQQRRLTEAGRMSWSLTILLLILVVGAIFLYYHAFPLLSFALNIDSAAIRWSYIGAIVLGFVLGIGFGGLKSVAGTPAEKEPAEEKKEA